MWNSGSAAGPELAFSLGFHHSKWNPGRVAGQELAFSLRFYHQTWNPGSAAGPELVFLLGCHHPKWNSGRVAGPELAFSLGFYRQLYNQIQFAHNWDYAALQCLKGLLSLQRRCGRRNMNTFRLSEPLPERTSERRFRTIPEQFSDSCLTSRNFASRAPEALRA